MCNERTYAGVDPVYSPLFFVFSLHPMKGHIYNFAPRFFGHGISTFFVVFCFVLTSVVENKGPAIILLHVFFGHGISTFL